MAKKSDLKVGQVRELFDFRNPGRYGIQSIAKIEILALNQPREIQSRGSSSYVMHDDLVLVKILEYNGWRQPWGNRVFREGTVVGELYDSTSPQGRPWQPRWKRKELPPDVFLVKPIMLGELWDDEQKDAEQRAEEEAKARHARLRAAQVAQEQRLSNFFNEVGIEVSPPWGTHGWEISSNTLAEIIEAASGGIIYIGQVHEQDFFGENES